MKKEIKEFITDTIHKHIFVKLNDNLYIKQYQKDILDLYSIPYQTCATISELITFLNEVLEKEEIEEEEKLEEVLLELQEFNYYTYTHK